MDKKKGFSEFPSTVVLWHLDLFFWVLSRQACYFCEWNICCTLWTVLSVKQEAEKSSEIPLTFICSYLRDTTRECTSCILFPGAFFVLFAWPFLMQLAQKLRIPLLFLYRYAGLSIAIPQAVSGSLLFLKRCLGTITGSPGNIWLLLRIKETLHF